MLGRQPFNAKSEKVHWKHDEHISNFRGVRYFDGKFHIMCNVRTVRSAYWDKNMTSQAYEETKYRQF